MHVLEKLDLLGDSLIEIVTNLQELKRLDNENSKNIQELLSIAFHYCNIVVTTQELAKTTDIEPFKKDIMKQIRFIDEFILLTSDLSFISD